MYSSAFWLAAGERALKTFAQTLLAALTLSSVSIDVLHVNWVGALAVSLGATLYSLLTSLAGLIPAGSPTPAEALHAAQPAPGGIDPSLEITDALHQLDAQDPAQPAPVVVGPPAEFSPAQPSA